MQWDPWKNGENQNGRHRAPTQCLIAVLQVAEAWATVSALQDKMSHWWDKQGVKDAVRWLDLQTRGTFLPFIAWAQCKLM